MKELCRFTDNAKYFNDKNGVQKSDEYYEIYDDGVRDALNYLVHLTKNEL